MILPIVFYMILVAMSNDQRKKLYVMEGEPIAVIPSPGPGGEVRLCETSEGLEYATMNPQTGEWSAMSTSPEIYTIPVNADIPTAKWENTTQQQSWEQPTAQSWQQPSVQTWQQSAGQTWQQPSVQTWEQPPSQTWQQPAAPMWEQSSGQTWQQPSGQVSGGYMTGTSENAMVGAELPAGTIVGVADQGTSSAIVKNEAMNGSNSTSTTTKPSDSQSKKEKDEEKGLSGSNKKTDKSNSSNKSKAKSNSAAGMSILTGCVCLVSAALLF
ncbi:hypothetical protein TCON_2050 [Astathelohania contejeani]|uniref:Uncharacterized protein n=1 Tax=Astathelohania contejeani TaxID=164912 RepID=A0ABQ7HX44_9MICR|nr:hypothetical protein TCON_2050 [Thelohania contejeani]